MGRVLTFCFMDIFDLRDRLNSFDVSREVENSLNENADEIINLQKDNLSKGLNNENEVIGTYSKITDMYASGAITVAIGESPIKDKVTGQPYNLQWSGDLFDKTNFTKNNSDLYFNSNSSHVTDLYKTIGKHGNVSPQSIFGLPEEKADVLNYEILMPDLIRKLNDTLL